VGFPLLHAENYGILISDYINIHNNSLSMQRAQNYLYNWLIIHIRYQWLMKLSIFITYKRVISHRANRVSVTNGPVGKIFAIMCPILFNNTNFSPTKSLCSTAVERWMQGRSDVIDAAGRQLKKSIFSLSLCVSQRKGFQG